MSSDSDLRSTGKSAAGVAAREEAAADSPLDAYCGLAYVPIERIKVHIVVAGGHWLPLQERGLPWGQ
jgi:hypothetical protein